MSPHTIEDLPTEILRKIFLDLSDNRSGGSKAFLKVVRLVSRKLEQIGSTLLINRVTVGLKTTSLTRLEGICAHPEFRNSVTDVTIDLSYYDVKLAEDINYFGEHFGAQFFRLLELTERQGSRRADKGPGTFSYRLHQLWNVPDTFKKLHLFEHDDSRATAHQKNLIKLHKEYVRLTADQESVRLNNQHVRRLAAALKNLPKLHTIHLSDRLYSEYDRTRAYLCGGGITLEDPDFLASALIPSGWNGFMITAAKTSPPLEMLSGLLSHFGNSGIRPRRVALDLGIPFDLQIVRPTRTQATGIQRLVSKSSDIDLSFRHWARKNSLAVNNDRSRNEMLSLGSLITALTSTSKLQQLALRTDDYPVFYQFPNINLSDLLPLNSIPWPQLSHIVLNHVPFDIEDLIALVGSSRGTIKSFLGTSLFLRTDDWDTAIDVLRNLELLEHFELKYPHGGRYGARWNNEPFPREQVEGYVLRKIVHNPLLR